MTTNNWKKTFLIIWTGQFLSLLTSQLVVIAIILWISLKTGSAGMLAYSAAAGLLPQSILGLFVGVYIDRWNRKKIMMLSDSFIAFCTLIIAITFFTGSSGLWLLYLLLALRSAASAFHMPAMQASVPLLAPETELVRIAGINQTLQSVSGIAGAMLAAVLLSLFDIGWILMLDIFGAAVAVVSLLFVNIPDPVKEHKEEHNFIAEVKEGVQAVRSHKGMSSLFLFSIIATFFIMPVSVVYPLMTMKHFGGSVFQAGMIEVAWGAGMLLGGTLVSIKKVRMNKVVLMNIMYGFLGISLLLCGFLPREGYAGFVIFTGLAGVSWTVYNALLMALVQEKLNPAVLGRVFSMYFSVIILPSLTGLLGTGLMADILGLTTTFIIVGTAIFAVGIISFFIPSMLKLGRNNSLEAVDAS